MAKVSDNTICILDVGSVKTCVLVGEVTDAGLRYRGHGICDSKGSRKGANLQAISPLDVAQYRSPRVCEVAGEAKCCTFSEQESRIALSNVALMCTSCKRPVRIGHEFQGERKVRVCRKCGATLDK